MTESRVPAASTATEPIRQACSSRKTRRPRSKPWTKQCLRVFRAFVISRRSNELRRGENPHPAVVALPDRLLIPERDSHKQPSEKGGAPAGMNQLTRLRAAIRAWVGRRHVFERRRVAPQHRSRFVRTFDRHLEPDALDGVRRYIQLRRTRFASCRQDGMPAPSRRPDATSASMQPEISADGCQVFGHGAWRAGCCDPPALGSFGSCRPLVQSVTGGLLRQTLHFRLGRKSRNSRSAPRGGGRASGQRCSQR